MNWLDIVIIVAIAINTLLGLKMGLIKAVLSLIGLIVGLILAKLYYVPLAEQLGFIPQAMVAKVIAFAIIMIVVMLIAGVLASLLKWAASVMMLGWINRIGGAVFGLVMGAIFLGALLSLWVTFFDAGDTVTDSTLATILADFSSMILGLLPGGFDSTGPSI